MLLKLSQVYQSMYTHDNLIAYVYYFWWPRFMSLLQQHYEHWQVTMTGDVFLHVFSGYILEALMDCTRLYFYLLILWHTPMYSTDWQCLFTTWKVDRLQDARHAEITTMKSAPRVISCIYTACRQEKWRYLCTCIYVKLYVWAAGAS